MDSQVRHFLKLTDLEPLELHAVLKRASELKRMQRAGDMPELLSKRVLGILFEKSSTRTRISFEAAMIQMGGGAIFLSPGDTQLGRGEPLEDTARILSRMVDVVAVRTFEHEKLERFAAHCSVPAINALTDKYHPCQLLADIQTYLEHRGETSGRVFAWVGDGNNMCHSYINAARSFDFELRIACPSGYDPDADVMALGGDRVSLVRDPDEAVRGADLVVTDVWASMGQEDEQRERVRVFGPYQVNAQLMRLAKPDALVMHCLPAHRGEEITSEVLEGAQSVVWDEAENRLHAQKALLEFLLRE
ncbi:MAG: ornithine carbamoyltransferase [Gammaproteobacteria bacterium]|nr:ornithine carbamoyltransferase [Gammaproteobacteria bacterium]NIR82855.1 ornithine carbamoyltransferase [Gammaproteobacteria bacterium]NIR89964.1 ornithine carbamoyltransferase [Gammaproteobacteria bacterium]NIU04013.1 ornithine carbamoyltransferase [Gammaproteobacteria bacterium]NIV51333.1 ornithine carbamoyltransferase [Gammaproteobacteria bacterium]